MQQSATQSSKTALWRKHNTKNFLTDYAEHVVTNNFDRGSTYYLVRCDEEKWLVCSKFSLDKVMSCENTPKDVSPKFVHVRKVTLSRTSHEDTCQLHCTCSFYKRVGLPCSHVLLLCHKVEPSMCKVRWWKVYHYSYLNDYDVTEEIDNFLKKGQSDPSGITVSVDNLQISHGDLPQFGEGVTDNIYEVLVSIHSNYDPVIYDGPYVTELQKQLVLVNNENDFPTVDEDGVTDYCGMHSEVALSQERSELNTGNSEFTQQTTVNSLQNRYHRCMAAVNEVLKVCVESEESTSLFIEKIMKIHNEMIGNLSGEATGQTITCCLPLESRKSSKRRKTLGYI
jgi:hypothetical protein